MSASQAVATWILGHRRSILLVIVLAAAAGFASIWSIPVALFPNVHFPRVVVDIESGDRPAERMAVEITKPIEEAVRILPGIDTVRSVTSRGEAEISLTFGWNEDMDTALLRTESTVNQAMAHLPAGTAFTVRRMDPTVFPCLAYSFISDARSLADLRHLVQYDVRPQLATIHGVAKVDVWGGAIGEIEVIVDPERLAAHGLGFDQVGDALAKANIQSAVGRIEDNGKLYLVIANAPEADLDAIASVAVRAGSDGVVRIADVARVIRGEEPHWTRLTADGHDAVALQVYQQPGGNTVAIARGIETMLDDLRKKLPADVTVATWYDQSELIVASAGSVRDAVIIGTVLAAIVILLFLRNLRVTVVALIAVPTVLGTTVLGLYMMGMSFNIMTLGGMAAAVGLIIDDAIVMVEHLVARTRLTRARDGASLMSEAVGFAAPLAGSSAATVVIFIPLAFLSGVTGAFFKALSLTMAFSLVVSFIVALFAVPLVMTLVITAPKRETDHTVGWLGRGYARGMGSLLRHPWLVALIIAPLLAIGWVSYDKVGTGFMPSMDEGGFILDYRAAPGTALGETERMLNQIEVILRATPEVSTYTRRTGLQLGGGITEANEGDLFVRLKPQPRRSCEEVMDDIRGKVQGRVVGLDIELLQLMEDLIGDLIANPHPIEIVLTADNGAVLLQSAIDVAKRIEGVKGVVDINNGVVIAGDAIEIEIDHDRAALEGIDADSAAKQVQGLLSGTIATQVQDGPAMLDVRVWTPRSSRAHIDTLARMSLRAPDGHVFPVSRIATLHPVTGQPQIMHQDLRRVVAVTARISGRDLGSTIDDLKKALAEKGVLQQGVSYRLAGLYQQQQTAFVDLTKVLAAAVVLVFILLVYLYESFRGAIAVMITTLLSVAGVFIGLACTHTELNITALMGMTMIVGIVTEVAIIFYSQFSVERPSAIGEGAAAEDRNRRLIDAGLVRMRPIAMTIVAAVFALLPLAIGYGEGSAMQRPLAIAIISGLILQMPLSVIVLPSLLALFRVR